MSTHQIVGGRRTFRTMDDFAENLHEGGTGLLDYNGDAIPCIYIELEKYQHIIRSTYGKKFAVDVLLNIFHNVKVVFVDVEMNFLDLDIHEYFLLYANIMLPFFEALSKSGLIALAPEKTLDGGGQNLFLIQLPKIEAAKRALKIKSNS